MPSLNKVLLIGNLTGNPNLRHTPKGTPVVEIGLAFNRNWIEEGQRREETTFVDVTLWGRQAEIAQQHLRRGSPVFIEGRLQLDSWDDKQTGQKRSRMRVVAENLQLIEKPMARQPSPPTPRAPGVQPSRPAPVIDPDLDVGKPF